MNIMESGDGVHTVWQQQQLKKLSFPLPLPPHRSVNEP